MAEDERIAENRGRSHSRRASAGARGGAHDTLHGDPRNRHVVIHTIFTHPGFVVVKPRRPSSAALVKPWYVEQHGLRSRSPQEQETQGDEQYPCKRPVLAPERSLSSPLVANETQLAFDN